MGEIKSLRIVMLRNGSLKQQHHITTLCRFFVESGVQLGFVSLQAPVTEVAWFAEQVPGMHVHHCGDLASSGVSRFLAGGAALRRILSGLEFDVLYIVDSWTLPYVAVATFGTLSWKNRPLVYHTFDMLVPGVAPGLHIALERYAARKSRLNINTDRSRAEVVKVLFGLRETPLSVPIRLSRKAIVPGYDEQFRRTLLPVANNAGNFLVVCPTGLSAERRGKEIIRAFASLPESYHFVTVEGEGEYGQECFELAKRLEIQDRVHILAPMPHENLLKICACADVGIIFHDSEGSLGNYLCHPSRLAYFLALGLPMVATDVPVLEALIYRYDLGVCCVSTDHESIAGAIAEICSGDVSLPERRRKIRQAFESDLYYERSAVRLLEALHGII